MISLNKYLPSLLALVSALFFIGCATQPKLQGLAKNVLGKNQYFDRLNEFANFGSHPDYFFLLGYNFEDADQLLMSTNPFDFGDVPTNFTKTRKFSLMNPFPKQVSGAVYQIEGSSLFSITKTTCKAILKGHEVCTLTIQFHPKTLGPDHSVIGRQNAVLKVKSSVGPELVKELAGSVTR